MSDRIGLEVTYVRSIAAFEKQFCEQLIDRREIVGQCEGASRSQVSIQLVFR